MNPTFESFLTPAGLIVAAALVTGTIEVLKTAFPLLDARVSGAAQAFVLTAILYIIAGLSTGATTADAWLAVFAAWLSCATAAIGIKSTYVHLGVRASKSTAKAVAPAPPAPPKPVTPPAPAPAPVVPAPVAPKPAATAGIGG